MPAAYLHEVIARRANKLMDIDFIQNHAQAYEAGAQGPDIMFFYRQLSILRGSNLNNLGMMMHSIKCIDFLVHLINTAKGINEAMAYCCGFLAHYSADSIIHPFVDAMAAHIDRGLEPNIAHMQLEAEFDTWIYREQGLHGIPKQAVALGSLTKDDKQQLSHILSDSIKHTYPEQYADQSALCHCFSHMKYVVGFLHSPKGIKYAILSFFEKLAGHPGSVTCHMVPRQLPEFDFLNLNKTAWEHPHIKGHVHNLSLPELIDEAVEKSVLLIRCANEYFTGASSLEGFIKATDNLSYTGARLV